MSRPRFEFPEEGTVQVLYIDSNGFARATEIISLAHLQSWINQEIVNAYAEGRKDKSYEVRKALGLESDR